MLSIVPGPIGNLNDITLRALEVLKQADMILAEDTRKSIWLLKHFGITKPMIAYHAHNEHKITGRAGDLIQAGKKIALLTDSGTPGISDPGYLLITHCIQRNLPFECLPGPVAFVPALLLSGFSMNEFLFVGFLPTKKGRQQKLKQLSEEGRTFILYESPNRILKLMEELKAVCGEDRNVSVSKEITKLHEFTFRGSIAEVLKMLGNASLKGEFAVVVEGKKH